MFFLDLCSKLEWVEVSSEVSYNRCRSAVFSGGMLAMYQTGSPSLGPSGLEDVEKGLVAWDVYKCTRLNDLKVSQLLSWAQP